MKNINLTIATGINGKGGIATVLQVLNAGGLFNSTNSKLITSHISTNKVKLILTFIWAILSLCYYLLFYKVGVVHIHMASRGSYFRKSKLIRIAKIFKAKVIIHLHGGEFNIFYSKESSKAKQGHIRSTFNMADKVIVLSEKWLLWVNSIIEDQTKTLIIYNAVPKIAFKRKVQKKDIILFLGKLCEGKGVSDLITAFSSAFHKHPNTELHFAGNGDVDYYKARVEALGLTNHIRFLGWVSGEIKNEYLANACIYCLPSYNEGFPMGVLEAMSSEVVVVASKVGGIPDAITHDKEGLLIEAGDVDALTVALSKLLADATLRSQLAKAAKVKYENNFTPEIIVPQLCKIYKELLEAK